MKIRLFYTFAFFSLLSCKQELEIIPLSPYEQTVSYAGWDTTKEYFYALKNYSSGKKDDIDSFVLKKLPRELLKEGHAINFCFYTYETGKIDERFVHKEQLKQQNLFLEAGAKSLIKYSWLENKFLYVIYYDNDKANFEKRNW
jgi:hypothetical protein